MMITLHTISGQFSIGPWRDAQADARDAAAPGPLAPGRRFDALQASAFLHRHVRDSLDIVRLRAALSAETGADVHGLVRLRDDDVIREVARRLSSGRWIVVDRPALRADGQQARTRLPAKAPERAPRIGARPPPPPRAARSAPVSAAAGAPPVVADWSESSEDQVAQAVTLEKASERATPFCAICEAARKRRAEAAA